MTQTIFIGIGAGAVAALLFASLATGSLFSLLLCQLSPLPIVIAGIGSNYRASLVAALCATAAIALAFGLVLGLTFLFSIALPAWWLSYLALLARPVEGAQPARLEWYPPGRLLLWTVFLGGIIVTGTILYQGLDAESLRMGLRNSADKALKLGFPQGTGTSVNSAEIVDLMAMLLPPLTALTATAVFVINLWLAARITKLSGWLRRPWPDLSAMTFPRITPALLVAAVAGTFLPGLGGMVANVFVAPLILAYVLLGFAVLHTITYGIYFRPFALAAVYAAVIVLISPALILLMLGLADTVLDIRGRVARQRGLPRRPLNSE